MISNYVTVAENGCGGWLKKKLGLELKLTIDNPAKKIVSQESAEGSRNWKLNVVR